MSGWVTAGAAQQVLLDGPHVAQPAILALDNNQPPITVRLWAGVATHWHRPSCVICHGGNVGDNPASLEQGAPRPHVESGEPPDADLDPDPT